MQKEKIDDSRHSHSVRNRSTVKREFDFGQRFFSFAQMGVFYCVLVAVQTLLFVYFKELNYKLVAYSLILGALLGICLRIFEWSVSLLKGLTTYFMGRLLAGFVLFFVYLIGYMLLFSFVVANPLGTVIQQTFGSVELSRDYGLYSVNSIIVLAVLSWMNWLRSIAWNSPKRVIRSRASE